MLPREQQTCPAASKGIKNDPPVWSGSRDWYLDQFLGKPRPVCLAVTIASAANGRNLPGIERWSAIPSSHTISSALRVGIESFGIPEILYVDNGKDYEKVGRIDFSPECSGVLVRLGIQPQYCLPRHPQSKLIESWFGTVRKRFDCLWPSYCGPGPNDGRQLEFPAGDK